jgi:hypothetical protein
LDSHLHQRRRQEPARLKRTEEVPPQMVRSLDIKETFFAQRWLGYLLVNERKFAEAIPYLEKASIRRSRWRTMYYGSGVYSAAC